MDRTFCLGEVRKWETLEKFDDATFIVADHEHPGILYAYVDEDLSARIARTLIKISLALGPLGGLGPAGLSVNTPLRAALATGFQYAERPDDYDAWIAALEDVAAFLRAEKANLETELTTTLCPNCSHPWCPSSSRFSRPCLQRVGMRVSAISA